MRYVVDAAEPFIVKYHAAKRPGDDRVGGLDTPLPTQTTENRFGLAVPTLVQTGYGEREGQAPRALDIGKPLGTVVAGQKHALVQAFLAKHYTGVVGSDLNDPMATVTSVDHHSLVTAHITKFRADSAGQPLQDPMCTVTANSFIKRPGGAAPIGVVTSHMLKLRGDNVGSAADEPLHTISAQGTHHGEVRAFLIKYYGTDQDPQLAEPLHTVTTKDRFGLVTIKGEPYAIVDIGLRMLTPRELYRAQGFPESYIIDRGADGRPMTKTAQVRMCGHSVCPPLARAIVAANYVEPQRAAANDNRRKARAA
jgi:DNA (cytosine-5)-methyltransferase 1